MSKKRSYNKSFVIDIDIYQTRMLVCFGNKTEFERALRKLVGNVDVKEIMGNIEKDDVGRMIGVKETGLTCVWVKDNPWMVSGIGILCHELLHAVIWIMNRKGLELADSSEEAYTYLYEYLIEEVLTKVAESEETEQ